MKTKACAVVFEAVGKAALRDIEIPAPGKGEVLLENAYTVVSAGTERASLMNLPNTAPSKSRDFSTVSAPTPGEKYPHFPGYSGIGKVIAVGEGVTGIPLGARALSRFSGHRSHALQPADGLTLVADERVDSLEAAFTVIGAMGVQGVRKLRLELGESALVIGLGILGMFAVQAALSSGAVPVLATDFDPKRRALAKELGAEDAFAPDDPQLPEKVRALTRGRGADGVVEVTGSAVALRQALTLVAREGRVSLTGCTRVSDAPIDFYQQVHLRGVSLIGAHTFVRPQRESRPGYWTEADDYRTLLALLAAKRLKVKPLISEVVAPGKAPEVYKRLAENTQAPLGVVFDWREAR